MGSPRRINFAKASKKIVLRKLEVAFKNCSGRCALPEIPYTLFKKAIDSEVGEIVSPFRINRVIKNSDSNEGYVHSILVYGVLPGGANFSCYTDRPIDRRGNFIEPSQLSKERGDWPRSNI